MLTMLCEPAYDPRQLVGIQAATRVFSTPRLGAFEVREPQPPAQFVQSPAIRLRNAA
jgi:hypothetical protein